MAEDWVADVLGPGFEALTIPLAPDGEGEVVCTVVRAFPKPAFRWPWQAPPPLADVDVLYIHGWSDYFFQTELARFWTERGARFHALDLRKYGRSLRPYQTPGYITDLATYDEDIAAALAAIGHPVPSAGGEEPGPNARRLVLLGHSTGGLTLSLWVSRHPGVASALILNSPWLEFQLSRWVRQAVTPLLGLQARIDPRGGFPNVDFGFYTRAQTEAREGAPAPYDTAWRPERGFPVHAGWLNAVMAGHREVTEGLQVEVPVLVLLSDRTAVPTRWSEELVGADSVLVVEDIARSALRLGHSVTVVRVHGALHDVFLSRPAARDEAFDRLGRWVTGFLAAEAYGRVRRSSAASPMRPGATSGS